MKKTTFALLILAAAPSMLHAEAKKMPMQKAMLQHETLMLSGATNENRMEIENLAKAAGAKKASLNTGTGEIKLEASQHGFDKKKFENSLNAVTGVSLKQ